MPALKTEHELTVMIVYMTDVGADTTVVDGRRRLVIEATVNAAQELDALPDKRHVAVNQFFQFIHDRYSMRPQCAREEYLRAILSQDPCAQRQLSVRLQMPGVP